MAGFEPIAIVGLGAVLPGALTPEALWDNVVAGKSLIGPAPEGRWGLPHTLAMGTPKDAIDRTWSDSGGYVTGFEKVFRPEGFEVSADIVRGLDPLFQWVLHAGREALRGLKFEKNRAGLVLGNLSFPSNGSSRWAERTWLEQQPNGVALAEHAEVPDIDARNRFNSGLPALLASDALGLGLGGFALDAACASSLYAIKLACDRLADRDADLMLAGAVQRADDLFIHIGFCALSAMSKTGQSRPFHKNADGLVPGEGCGLVALMRYDDAVARGVTIHGVIRGVGLSNDGRGRGMLAPSEDGQARALRLAYEMSGLQPADISLLECHATGTPVGDATEVRATAQLYHGLTDVPMGSLKSNLGHLVTVAGVAALMKVLFAMKNNVRPPTLGADEVIPALVGSPFRLLQKTEPWISTGPKRAGISAFGFGGNNAHLLVEEPSAPPVKVQTAKRMDPIAIVGLGARVGEGDSARDLLTALFQGTSTAQPRTTCEVALAGLKFPPKDLDAALGQQLTVLEAAREAVGDRVLPRDRTAVLIGMGCDPTVARYGARWRSVAWAKAWGIDGDTATVAAVRDAFIGKLEASGVLGTMPNIPANRISSQLDLAGPGYTVSSEELSGIDALKIAMRALRVGEIDAAVVGAVDMSHEAAHLRALKRVSGIEQGGDAAVVLLVKRLADAQAAGDDVLAVIHDVNAVSATDVTPQLGRPHAALGLLRVVAAAVEAGHGVQFGPGEVSPRVDAPARRVDITSVFGHSRSVTVGPAGTPRGFTVSAPQIFVFAGADRAAVAKQVASGTAGGAGPARLVIVCAESERIERTTAAANWLRAGGPTPAGVAYADRAIGGEVALVYPGPAGAYAGMGRELLIALPELGQQLAGRASRLASALEWVYGSGKPDRALDKLWGASALSQLHTLLAQDLLGIRAQAGIGYSSGESNALIGLGAWTDVDAFVEQISDSPLFHTGLVGDFTAAKSAWKKAGVSGKGWVGFGLLAAPDRVAALVADEPTVHVTAINGENDCAIAGDPEAVARVLAKLGDVRSIPLNYDLTIHAPEVAEVRQAWFDLHRRPTVTVPVRFYTNATGKAYVATADAAAEALTVQALQTIDFPRTIRQAYADGVRVFIEMGPRSASTRWIRAILGDQPHVAVGLDGQGLRPVFDALAALIAHQVPVEPQAFLDRLAKAVPAVPKAQRSLTFAAHPPDVVFPPLPKLPEVVRPLAVSTVDTAQRMRPAPILPSVLGEGVVRAVRAAPEPLRMPLAPGAKAPIAIKPRVIPVSAPVAAPPAAVKPAPVAKPSVAPTVSAPIAAAVAPAAVAMAAATSPQAYAPQNTASAPNPAVFAHMAAVHAQIAAVHAQFVSQQAAVHEGFLGMRHRLLEQMRQASGGTGSAPAFGPPAGMVLPAPVAQPTQGPVSTPTALPVPSAGPKPAAAPAAAPVATPAAPLVPEVLPGPKWGRKQLETLASGRISDVFGPEFRGQDDFFRQVRMPEPPLLLADRVTGIRATPKSMKTGTIWTETDVTAQSWYLNDGYMPAGVHIESGQADLLLISYLGVDFLNRSERAYRLLGCELTWHAAPEGHVLPRIGETLQYDIHVDGHANQGDIRLFFFHYDCKINGTPRLTVRSGQAGFFTDAELKDSGGILWDAATGEHSTTGPLAPPVLITDKRAFTAAELHAFTEGRPWECFGEAWYRTRSHVRTPRFQTGKMLFLKEVSAFDPKGGPWGRGYLRAEWPVSPDDWFFQGHFKNDPCMPGTMMFEGCVQTLAFYLAAMGFTAERDGWRFEPVPENKFLMRCRGQVLPSNKHLTYEIFVEEVIDGPVPMVFADLLCTVDGLKAFHARKVGLRLVPAWPLTEWRQLPVGEDPRVFGGDGTLELPKLGGLAGYVEPKPVAISSEGFPFDYNSLLACAWGRPSEAFGPIYTRFDSHRRVARLPGPPYHFMSRITRVDGPLGVVKAGTEIEVEYDIPKAVWYFDENGVNTMPFAVLMEAALQPCGWLASYVGSALTTDIDLLFRNLDGTGTLHQELRPWSGVLRTISKMTSVSMSAGMIIENFEVKCFFGETLVFEMKTVFGFFPKEAFDNQVGLPYTPEEKARIDAPDGDVVDLRERPAKYTSGTLTLANPMLLMLDRVTTIEPHGGKKGLGFYRGEKVVDPGEWFFKAHFFQDPVQPGSLGVEAVTQLLQFAMIEKGLGEGLERPRFEPVALGKSVTWKYRGQVVPKNKKISSEVEIIEIGEDAQGRFAVCDAALWVDGKRIYGLKNLAMRIVSSVADDVFEVVPPQTILDPAVESWLNDHRPTWTLPALPAMSMVDKLAGAVSGTPIALRDVAIKRWLPFPGGPVRLQTSVEGGVVTLSAWRDAADAKLSRFEPVATGVVEVGAYPLSPNALPALTDGEVIADPYATGALFHGPAFQCLTELRLGATGSSAVLDAAKVSVPYGKLNQGLLDAMTHAIPHDALAHWSTEIPADVVGYPYRIPVLNLYGVLPTSGLLRVEVRFAGFDGAERFPMFDLQLIDGVRVLADLRLVEVLLPKGPLGNAPRTDRVAFLRDRQFVPGVALSTLTETAATVDRAALKTTDWLPGNVARIYNLEAGDAVAQIALKDEVARRAEVHPSRVHAAEGGARLDSKPLRLYPVGVISDGYHANARTVGPDHLDLRDVRAFWDKKFNVGRWPIEDVYYGLIDRYVRDVILENPDAIRAIKGRSVLYVANHQVGVESLLFSVLASAISGVSTVTLAKAEHRHTWLGKLIALAWEWPGVTDPRVITFFDREDKPSLIRIIGQLAAEMATVGKSAMIHVEGTRSLECRSPVEKMSSAFIDMALQVGAPIVPVRLYGGLPMEPLAERIEFPVGHGKQDYWIGTPILPEQLAKLPLKDRKQVVIDTMNALGPSHAVEQPYPGDEGFAAKVDTRVAATGATPEHAALLEVLREQTHPTAQTQRLLTALDQGELALTDSAEDRWLAEFAKRLFGERGPKIRQ